MSNFQTNLFNLLSLSAVIILARIVYVAALIGLPILTREQWADARQRHARRVFALRMTLGLLALAWLYWRGRV